MQKLNLKPNTLTTNTVPSRANFAVLAAMSTQKGNTSRSRPQKYKNKTAFKNTLNDKSRRTKTINAIQVSDVCQRCKEIIEWKIKYKKYKPLSQPKKCVKCDSKTVKKAYHIMCDPCGQKLGVCAKCDQSKELVQVPPSKEEQFQLDEEMRELLKSLPERKRRTFIRYMNRSSADDSNKPSVQEQKEDILNKLNSLKVNDDDILSSSEDDDDNDDSFSEPE